MSEFTARATEVDRAEPVQLAVSDLSGTTWHYMTKDQAAYLAMQLTDAVDELEKVRKRHPAKHPTQTTVSPKPSNRRSDA